MAAPGCRPRGDRHQAGQGLEQGGLSASGWAEEHNQFSWVNLQVYTAQGMHLYLAHLIDLGQTAYPKYSF